MYARLTRGLVALGLAILAAYGGSKGGGTPPGGDTTPPTVLSTQPADGARDVPVSGSVSATFSEAMEPSSAIAAFTLRDAGGNAVAASVSYAGTTATLTPLAPLAGGSSFIASISKAAKDLAGNALAASTSWSFTTHATANPPAPPASLSAAAGDASVTLTWPASTGATSYNLYWSLSAGVTKANGTQLAAVTSPYSKGSLQNGTAYHYVVTAVNAAGESAESPEAVATPSANATP